MRILHGKSLKEDIQRHNSIGYMIIKLQLKDNFLC